MKADYTKLDALILGEINDKPVTFTQIMTKVILAECEKILSAEPKFWGKPPSRVLDGRLQSIKRAGKISFNTKGWIRVSGQSDSPEKTS